MALVKFSRRAFVPAALLAFGAAGVRAVLEPPFERTLESAVMAVASAQPGAERQVRKVLAHRPGSAEGNWLLGTLLVGRHDPFGALVCFRRVPTEHRGGTKARIAEGDQLFEIGDALRAEEAWRAAWPDQANEALVNQRLLALFGFQLRRVEWTDAVWREVEAGRGGLRELVQLIIAEHVIWQGSGIVEMLERFVAANPDDILSRASLVHHLLAGGRSAEAKGQLDLLLESTGDAEVGLLTALAYSVADAEPAAVERLIDQSRPAVREALEARVEWKRGLGELALLRGSVSRALPLLESAAETAPFHPAGRQALALAHRLMGRPRDAELHASVAGVLARLDRACHTMQNAGRWSPEQVLAVARDSASVGMVEEAKVWLRFLLRDFPSEDRAARLLARLDHEPRTSRRSPPRRFLDPVAEARRW